MLLEFSNINQLNLEFLLEFSSVLESVWILCILTCYWYFWILISLTWNFYYFLSLLTKSNYASLSEFWDARATHSLSLLPEWYYTFYARDTTLFLTRSNFFCFRECMKFKYLILLLELSNVNQLNLKFLLESSSVLESVWILTLNFSTCYWNFWILISSTCNFYYCLSLLSKRMYASLFSICVLNFEMRAHHLLSLNRLS